MRQAVRKPEPSPGATAFLRAAGVTPRLRQACGERCGCDHCGANAAVASGKGAGRPMQGQTRASMERLFGHSFADVRVHADAGAAQSARQMRALAYTSGSDIVFAHGQYAPHTREGRKLLAHELTHVVQQRQPGPNHAARKLQRKPAPTTEQMHHEIAEADRRQAGYAPGEGPSDSQIVHSGALAEVPDLPATLARALAPACEPAATPAQRQAAVAALHQWARANVGDIDWTKVASVRFDTAAGARGSRTEAGDRNRIEILLGPVAFSSPANLYSTLRHELVHVREHQTRPLPEIVTRGTGAQEVYAYLWELEHQQDTGLSRRARWGLRQDGTADPSVGLARAVDGLFRALSAISAQLQRNPQAIPAAELQAIEHRVACVMMRTPREVVTAVLPSAPFAQWQQECASPQRPAAGGAAPAVQPAQAPGEPVRVSSPGDQAEAEADAVASRVADGAAAPTITAAPSEPTVFRQPAPPQQAPAAAPAPTPAEPALPQNDGCQDPAMIARARSEAARLVEHAVAALDDPTRPAAALLLAHFHLDAANENDADDIRRVRDQFVRMGRALRSPIRVLCRSAPGLPGTSAAPHSPVDEECRAPGRILNASSTACAGGDPSATVKLCDALTAAGNERDITKTLIHEFAHVACNGDPPISSGGVTEVYYEGGRFPGNQTPMNHADAYAWFAMEADAVGPQPAPPPERTSGRSRLPWLAVLGIGLGLTIAGIFAPGLLVGGALGLLIGGLGLAGAFG